MPNFKMWIGGQWVDAASGKTYPVFNPATEEEIAQVPLGDRIDVDRAVEAARKAFQTWGKTTQTQRCEVLNRIAGAIREHSAELADLDILDHGSPKKMAYGVTLKCAGHFEYAAQVSRALMGEVITSKPNIFFYLQREPVGVCALIVPWNVPLMMITTKMSAALAMGNACVIKPPSVDSLVALKLAGVLEKLDLPVGLVNVVTGPGGTVGEALASHPGVDLVSFTGSCETGKAIMASASRTVKRVFLELGGKNPFIVLEDADLEMTVTKAVMGTILNSGQVCAAPGRFYVPEKLRDEFVDRFVAVAGKIAVGNPQDERVQMGPLVSAEHRDKVEGYIRSGVEEGAKLVLGGQRPSKPPLNKGYFVTPTVLTGVTQNMKIAREEIFGPVACILKYSSEDEVIKLANDNVYGLSASVWTKDIPRGIKIANEINAGAVWINDHMINEIELPWGGVKESGFGKENSILGLEEYTRKKLISFDLNEGKS